MPPKIVISHNCQTPGIAYTLRAIFPDWIIKPSALPHKNDEVKIKQLAEEVASAQFWITSGHFQLADGKTVRLLKTPEINFPAFHPDLRYASINPTGTFTKFHYNSQIVAWAFNHRLGIEHVRRLFNEKTFAMLGYFDEWERSVEIIRKSFAEHEISANDFSRLFDKVKRTGVFMHSVNHPHPIVITELAKIFAGEICSALGLNYANRIHRSITVPDFLAETIWPVYPEIAEALGIEGDYCWRIERREIYSLDSYIKYAFGSYRSQNLQPGDLRIIDAHADLDNILRNQL